MSFYTDVIQKDSRFKSNRVVRDTALLEPVTRKNVLAIIEAARSHGAELVVGETYRSKERQYLLWRDRKSKLATVGVHHFGLACDLYIKKGTLFDWTPSHYKLLGDLCAHHGMIWGGDWGHPGVKSSFYDGVHIQRVTTKKQDDLFALKWYPDDKYDPRTELGLDKEKI